MNLKRGIPRFKRNDAREEKKSSELSHAEQKEPSQRWRSFLTDLFFAKVFGPAIRILGALLIGLGGLILAIAWNYGPRQLLDSLHFDRLSQRVEGHVVESWLALDVDLGRMGKENIRWRAFAKASPCMVVEYESGKWDGALQRAFCGNMLSFTEAYTLVDLQQLAPQVPFFWNYDDRGFAVPEIRMDQATLGWLAGHPPGETSLNFSAATALEQLRSEFDRPIDHVIVGWMDPRQDVAIMINPRNPAEALPAGYIDERRKVGSNWLIFTMFATCGFVLWSQGMRMMFGHLREGAVWVMILLPLLAIPWWGDSLPRVLRVFDVQVSGVVGDMFGDLDPLGRFVASDAASAQQAFGARLSLPPGQGVYAETFGRLILSRPEPRPESADAALAALADGVHREVRAMSLEEQIVLFVRLSKDKTQGLPHAGLVFLPVAKEILLDPESDEKLRSAAYSFLSNWLTQPILEPQSNEQAFAQRLQFFRDLADIPVPEIAHRAKWVVDRADPAK